MAAGHQVEPDLAQLAQRYGPDTPVPYWRERLVCSWFGSRDVDFRGERDRVVSVIAVEPEAVPLIAVLARRSPIPALLLGSYLLRAV